MKRVFRLKSYLQYLLRARGIQAMHSPFVYDFMEQVLKDHRTFYAYDEVEELRNQLLAFREEIDFEDFGMGSDNFRNKKRTIASIAKNSLKPPNQAQLLFRIVHYYNCRNILELGTSLGLTTCYLSGSRENSRVITLEGSETLAKLAEKNFSRLGRKNISCCVGEFDTILPGALQKMER